MSLRSDSDEIFLHIENENSCFYIPFYWKTDKYISKPNEPKMDTIPRSVDRGLISKNIIKCIYEGNETYYILEDINCHTVINDYIISISEIELPDIDINKYDDKKSSITKSTTVTSSTHRFDQDDTTESIVSKLMSQSNRSYMGRTNIQDDTLSRYSRDTRDTRDTRDIDDTRKYVVKPSPYVYKSMYENTRIDTNIPERQNGQISSKPKLYVASPVKQSTPKTPDTTTIKKRIYESPADYKSRYDIPRDIKRKFVYEKFTNPNILDISESVELYAKQDRGNIYIFDSNHVRAGTEDITIAKIDKNKLRQAKFIIKGYFNLNTCTLSESTGLIIINNISLDDFSKQISSLLVLM